MQNPQCFLNDNWLLECISRFKAQGLSDDQLFDFANQWELAAFDYACWLEEEGFPMRQSLQIVDTALQKADFDLTKFPVCKGI
jgi:hypothetical protein